MYYDELNNYRNKVQKRFVRRYRLRNKNGRRLTDYSGPRLFTWDFWVQLIMLLVMGLLLFGKGELQ